MTESRVVDDVAVVADEELPRSVMGSYFTMDGGGADQDPVYESSIGLAVEGISGDTTLKDLWNVM